MSPNLRNLSSIGLLFFVYATVLQAETITYREGDGKGDVSVNHATMIRDQLDSDTNFDTDGTIVIHEDVAHFPFRTRALVGFFSVFGAGTDQIPLGSIITSATLTLWVTNVSPDQQNVHRVLTAWDEATVTWNSFNTGGVAGTDYVTAPDTTFRPCCGAPLSTAIDVTTVVQEWSEEAPNLGIFIINSASDFMEVISETGAELSERPELSVTFEPSPLVFLDSFENDD
jgi:hypothetical protein